MEWYEYLCAFFFLLVALLFALVGAWIGSLSGAIISVLILFTIIFLWTFAVCGHGFVYVKDEHHKMNQLLRNVLPVAGLVRIALDLLLPQPGDIVIAYGSWLARIADDDQRDCRLHVVYYGWANANEWVAESDVMRFCHKCHVERHAWFEYQRIPTSETDYFYYWPKTLCTDTAVIADKFYGRAYRQARRTTTDDDKAWLYSNRPESCRCI